MDSPQTSNCQLFKNTIALLAKPWTGHILWSLQQGPLRFNELVAAVEGIGEKVLSARLKELESRGLLVRRVHPTTPVRIEYELTCKGRGFGQVVDVITQWGELLAQPEEQDSGKVAP